MTGKNAASIGTIASILFASVVASAQEPAATPPAAAAPKAAAPVTEGGTDHESVVGHVGATIFPTTAIPLPMGTATAPVVGVRYWLMPNLGIDGGLGVGWFTGSGVSPFALAFHAGVPIALASSKHFTFIIAPEADLGFAHVNQPVPMMANNTADGLLIDLGGRVGAEIHFGFIGIPQLSLQGSLGLFYTHLEAKTNVAGVTTTTYQNNLVTGTNNGNNPWAIFTNNIEATYYL